MQRSREISFVQVVAALAIVNVHTVDLEIPYLRHIAKLGFLFNVIFVGLSGYFLGSSYGRSPKGQTVWAFFRRRISRMYPSLHIAVVLIALMYALFDYPFTIKSFLLTLTGLQYFFREEAFGPQLWFLSVILVCYCLFPVTHYLIKSWPQRSLLVMIAVFFSTVWFGTGSFYGIYNEITVVPLYRFLYHYIIFAGGIALAAQNVDLAQCFRKTRYLFLFVFCFPVYYWSHTQPEWGGVAMLFVCSGAIGVIALLLRLYPIVVKRLPILLRLAPVTYELYLGHYAIISILVRYYHGQYAAYPLTFLLSISFAFLIFHLSRLYRVYFQRLLVVFA